MKTRVPFKSTVAVPPYVAMAALDMQNYSRTPSSTQQSTSDVILQLVMKALKRSGLSEAWDARLFHSPGGDGFDLGIRSEHLSFLVHPFLAELERALDRYNGSTTRHHVAIRLRVAIHVGPAPVDRGDIFRDGCGGARNEVHRLLASDQLNELLATTGDLASVVAILSDRAYKDAVASGYTGRRPELFKPVRACVPGKNFEADAWTYVPAAPGGVAATQSGPGSVPRHAAAPQRAEVINYGQFAHFVGGDMRMGSGHDAK